MASSKSSQTTRNVLIAVLALWSIISLIIIVVWATSPDMKGASQCRQELQTLNEKLEGAKVVWTKDRRALEALVRQGWENQTLLQGQIDAHKAALRQINVSLDDCRQQNVLLSRNITALETQIEMHEAIEANLTALLSLQKDEIEGLQSNLTEKLHELDSCEARRDAAVSLQTAAEKTAAACRASKMYLQSQLVKCQAEIQKEESSQQQQPPGSGASSLGSHRWHLAWVLLTTILLALTS
ncbi:uncharacterized protein si:ch211-1a19.3 [Alosa sapidissima]|uniref:uncharacterized protein si:ch211-1a19.3 n=1 Tax=Alosa sapidissima TaxID=34773 RepID=UPI001C0A5390|nr:uncharacterized protein si:ch211-1a19.3 [Alosa sapidissima]